jgi:hypothetical protein
MTWEQFEAEPWQKSHSAYTDSFIAIRPAPEYASGEVLMSSLYRHIGFGDVKERDVPAEGRQFEKSLRKHGGFDKASSDISEETWRAVVGRVLESPKLPNQASKPFLQLTPIVPDIALYSGSARRVGNSWPAGSLIQKMILLGSASQVQAAETWQLLFEALSVDARDDIWAQWLQAEFAKRRGGSQHEWHQVALPKGNAEGLAGLEFPAQQFVRDLVATLAAKANMTRAQWVSLLGAIVRVGAVMHVLWLCDVHDRYWRYLRRCLLEGVHLNADEFVAQIFPGRVTYLEYGKPAIPVVRDYVNKYLTARLGINSLLWHLGAGEQVKLDSPMALHKMSINVVNHRTSLLKTDAHAKFLALQERESRTLGCKKGIGSNLVEFARHVLGQRQSATQVLRGYDQGYILKKKGTHASAPWVVSLGPVSVIALVHCCMHGTGGPRSVHRFAEHVAAYGMRLGIDDLSHGELGTKLRLLGLVLDSPDAETGMLLVPPFATAASEPT